MLMFIYGFQVNISKVMEKKTETEFDEKVSHPRVLICGLIAPSWCWILITKHALRFSCKQKGEINFPDV